MNTFQNPQSFQKFLHFLNFSFHLLECVVTIGLGALLILAWMITSPLLRLGVCLSDWLRARLNQKTKGWS